MSTYIVTKTINGRQYRYRQTTWREGGRMRTQNEYLGPAGGSARGAPQRGKVSSAARASESLVYSDGASRWEGSQAEGTARSVEQPASGVTEFLRALVRKRNRREDIGETEHEARERVAREDTQRARNDRVNELLTGGTITLDGVAEIAGLQAGGQQEGESADSPDDASESSVE
jgi:hypothetical protein